MKNLGRFSLKIAMDPIFMKLGTHNKSDTEMGSNFHESWR